jgi:hypothetical protein
MAAVLALLAALRWLGAQGGAKAAADATAPIATVWRSIGGDVEQPCLQARFICPNLPLPCSLPHLRWWRFCRELLQMPRISSSRHPKIGFQIQIGFQIWFFN